MSNVIAIMQLNKKALLHNYNYFKAQLNPNTKILAVVKANSYGTDSIKISKLLEKNKVDYLAVAYVKEGVELRKKGITIPILVLHPKTENLKKCLTHKLEPNIYSFRLLTAFLKLKKTSELPIHLKFNTGLNRLGFNLENIDDILSIIKENKLNVASVFSHLAASEDKSESKFTNTQIKKFEFIKTRFNSLNKKPLFHLLNTSGVLNYPNAQYDMVRVGIGLLGFTNEDKISNHLQNVVSLKSYISQIHTIKTGESVGYNRAFIAKNNTKIATISIGHADGVSRKLGNKNGFVFVNNQKAFIIGNVCMDMMMIDITNMDCKEGDEVYLFNSQKTILNYAKNIKTISYELLTMFGKRIKREWI